MFGVAVALTLALLPTSSVSKDDQETIVLTKDNTVSLTDVVTGESVAAVIDTVQSLNHGYKSSRGGPIYLFMRTPGGEIQAGMELIEALSASKRPIHTITAFAASMGFQIVQNMGDRLILSSGVLMSHRAAGGFQGSFGGRAPSQIDNRYALWLSRILQMDLQTVKRSHGKQTLQSYQDAYADEMWLTGEQSVAKGYADRIVKARCDRSLAGTVPHEANFMGFLISYKTFNCPMNSGITEVKVGIPGQSVDSDKADKVKELFTQHWIKDQNTVKPMVLE